MKYDSNKGKIKITKTVEVEIDPIDEITAMAQNGYYSCTIDNFTLNKLSGQIYVRLPSANKEWSTAVLKACLEFTEKYDAYISGNHDYEYNFLIQMKS